ncbi:zinc ribbon domain-containing protein [Clostridium sp. AL.422]|uniref:Zn-ribbon domain-containing OB-fold protein n=1 Tax=Clostridium TaxID=1485 RepID=UPI00293DEB37|nr:MULTISPECIES: OB-fold domain-containing protein [unclassified Clostridium]MDV4151410.1 zinc ribbon domain-containing protein [Clostridium sp. AL.422]
MSEKMYAYKCTTCGELHHPKHYVCRKCGYREFEEVELGGEVTLLTYTRVYNLPEGYMKPYLAFGIVKFDNGLTATGQIDSEELEIGMRLSTTVGVIKETVGKDCYGFIFKPIE